MLEFYFFPGALWKGALWVLPILGIARIEFTAPIFGVLEGGCLGSGCSVFTLETMATTETTDPRDEMLQTTLLNTINYSISRNYENHKMKFSKITPDQNNPLSALRHFEFALVNQYLSATTAIEIAGVYHCQERSTNPALLSLSFWGVALLSLLFECSALLSEELLGRVSKTISAFLMGFPCLLRFFTEAARKRRSGEVWRAMCQRTRLPEAFWTLCKKSCCGKPFASRKETRTTTTRESKISPKFFPQKQIALRKKILGP